MNIGEARKTYSSRLQTLREQKKMLQEAMKDRKKQELLQDMNVTNETGVILDLSEYSSELDKKIKETEDYLQKLALYSVAVHNREVAKQQGETMAKQADDVTKCMEIARRISNGHKVPPQDEKKLMEFNPKMYSMAKNMGSIAKNKERKEYKSLWEDEEEMGTKHQDKDAKIEDISVPMKGPELTTESVAMPKGELE